MACMMTGEISDDNLQLAGGKIVLSKQGIKELVHQLKEYEEV